MSLWPDLSAETLHVTKANFSKALCWGGGQGSGVCVTQANFDYNDNKNYNNY